MSEINSFTFYYDYYNLIDTLPVKDKSVLLVAIVDYIFKDLEPSLSGHNQAIFNTLKAQLNKSKNQSKKSKKNTNQKETEKKPKENQKDNQRKTREEPKEKQKENKTSVLSFKFLVSNFKFIVSSLNINNSNNKNNIYKLLEEYLQVRKKNKYTITETIVKRLVNKLNEYGKTDEEKMEIITNAINGAWKDFYPLKQNFKKIVEDEPNWYDKEIEEETATEEEIRELERVMNGKSYAIR